MKRLSVNWNSPAADKITEETHPLDSLDKKRLPEISGSLFYYSNVPYAPKNQNFNAHSTATPHTIGGTSRNRPQHSFTKA